MNKFFKKFKNKMNPKARRGFVLLFTIVLTAIILSVALGLSNISLREFTFSTSTKATGEAFYAADVGVECAIYWDLTPAQLSGGGQGDPFENESIDTFCAGVEVDLNTGTGELLDPWVFSIQSLGVSGQGCAQVSVTKNTSDPFFPITHVVSKGYNVGKPATLGDPCDLSNPGIVERQLEVDY